MTFDSTGIYKLFETPTTQIQRFFAQVPVGVPGFVPQLPTAPGQGQPLGPASQAGVMVPFQCPKCRKAYVLQADFDKQQPMQPGAERSPPNDNLVCSQCGMSHNLAALRRQLELQTRRKLAK